MTLHYYSTNGESQVEEPKKDWATGSAEHMVQMSKFMDGTMDMAWQVCAEQSWTCHVYSASESFQTMMLNKFLAQSRD